MRAVGHARRSWHSLTQVMEGHSRCVCVCVSLPPTGYQQPTQTLAESLSLYVCVSLGHILPGIHRAIATGIKIKPRVI